MPLYEYRCDDCDKEWEGMNRIASRENEKCPTCAKNATIVMSPGMRPVIVEYYSENLQAQVTGPAHRKELMKAKGLEERG